MSAREVTLVGGSPWGFRMHGGHDLHQPLRISRVNPGSKASQQGVREGDLISSINGRNTRDLTNSEAHTLLRNAGDQLKLGLNQESVGSPKRRIYKSSLQENTSIETIQKTTKTITTATRVESSEQKNGTDDTKHQNGNLTQTENTSGRVDRIPIKTPPLLETPSSDIIDKDLASTQLLTRDKHSSLSSEDADSERTIIDSNPESETEGEQDNINTEQEEYSVTESKESTKCTDDSNESTIDLKSKIFTGGASSVIETENGIQPTREIHEPQLTRQFDDKLRIFIKECDSEKHKSDDNNLLNHKCHVNEFKTCNSVIREHSENVESQENYSYETSTMDRYLDIIQEESEHFVPCERDIRDFINQEIGKFCRERRRVDVKDEVTETRNNEFESCHETISSSSRNENIPDSSKRENGKGVSFDGNRIYDVEATGSLVNQVNKEELASIKNRGCAPVTPKRSSSLNSMDVEKISRNGVTSESEINFPTISKNPHKVPDLPVEVVKILSESPPVRPPLPNIFNTNEGVAPIKTCLCNSEDVGKFGNDASVETLAKITHHHIDNISGEVLVKNTEASKESTSMCDSTVSTNIEVKCSRPQRNKVNDIKEKTTLEGEFDEKIEVESSNVVQKITESCCEYNNSCVDVWTTVNEKSQMHDTMKSIETKTEKSERTETTETSHKAQSTETNETLSTDPTGVIGLDNQSQESSSSTPSPATVKHISDEEQSSSKIPEPKPLKDLCIKRILSLPYGSQLINEITLPKFTIFKNLESIHKTVKTLQIHESEDLNTQTMKRRPTTWMGVPTEDPRLLVCLSPSQQATPVRTSADKLLDLHKKFLNRRSYHHDHRTEINVPKYLIEITPTPPDPSVFIKLGEKELKQLDRVSVPTNRLLEIVKENPLPMNVPSVTKSHKNVEQNPFKSTLVANWLTQSNNDHLNTPIYESPSCNFSSQRLRYQENVLSLVSHNSHITVNDIADIKAKRQGRVFDNTTIRSLYNDNISKVNTALILKMPEGESNQENRSTTPIINRSPITNRSAIIDRTSDIAEPRKWTLSRTIDTRQVNPALINDRPEAPPRCRRTVDVDRTCIDTTSIFDKSPPRGHSTKYQDPVALKQATASEIVDNLKDLQKDVKSMFDGRRRYSLPQEYFDRQLEYIETLEDQLKKVIIAEEEEEKALADFEGEIRRIKDVNSDKMDLPNSKQLHEDGNKSRQTWHEASRISDNSHTEVMRKEGHQESMTTVSKTPGRDVESSMKVFENKESISRVTLDGVREQEWPRYSDDIPRDSVDAEKRDHYEVHGKLKRPRSISILPTSDEVFRRRMYDEYIHKVWEREERKHHKVIKISSRMDLKDNERVKDNMSTMEKEFIEKARKRLNRFGIHLDETEQNEEADDNKVSRELFIKTNKEERGENVEAKCLIDGKEIRDANKLPKHLQEFLELTISELEDGFGYGMDAGGKTNDNDLLHEIDIALRDSKGFLLREENMFSPTFKASSAKPGVWSPGSEPPLPQKQASPDRGKNTDKDGEIPPVWTPSSAVPSPVVERKEFRPVSFESPILSRKNKPQVQRSTEEIPPWQQEDRKEASQSIAQNITTRIVNSHSVPSQGLNTLASPPRLPRAQNPTITLLQKAREGQLPKGAAYLEETTVKKSHEGARVNPGEIIYTVKREYESEPEFESDKPRKMADLGHRKILGIGPITKDGMPVALRSEVKDTNQAKWYKQMYDSLHRAGRNDDYVTIRYKPRRGTRYGYGIASGYLSEPEPRVSADRSATLDTRRRQRNKENDVATSTLPRKSALVKTTAEVYRNQPGRIENYQPGRSSISDKETKEWWDEVMDIFDGAEEDSQLGHPIALRTFIPTHQLVRSIHPTSRGPSTHFQHPKSSLRTTRAVLEYTDPDAIEVLSTSSKRKIMDKHDAVSYRVDPASVNLLLGRTLSTITAERLSHSLSKSPKYERNTTVRNRRNTRDRINRDHHSDDSIVVSFIDETTKPNDNKSDHEQWHPAVLEERSKSFVLPSASRRSPLSGNRTNYSNRESTYLTINPRNNHRNHQNQRRHDPSISSSTSSSSSSTIHITMLPQPPPPITTNVIAETALTSPSRIRPFDQRNPHAAKPYMSHALKESGYESDSTLIFRRRDDASPLSPLEQRLAYKTVQKGGDVPLHGLRKPAPERPKDDAEIEYFPISRTLTRIRVRRRTPSSTSMSSMTLDRYRRSTSSSTTPVSLSPANFHAAVSHKSSAQLLSASSISSHSHQKTKSSNRPPSPPRRLSSRHNVTLKLYTSSYPHPPNPRHKQCFTAEATSNIRFLKERLSNKLLKHEQGRIPRNSTIPRAPLTSPSSLNRAKLERSAFVKRKSEPCLLKKLEPEKSIPKITSPAPPRITKLKPPVVRQTKLPIPKETSRKAQASSSPPPIKKEQQFRNRQAVTSNALIGSVIRRSCSSLPRVRSQDTGLSKVISRSLDKQRTSGSSPTLTNSSPAPSTQGRAIIETFQEISSTANKFTSIKRFLPPATIVCDPSTRKKGNNDRPQIIVKSSPKKPEPIVITKNVEKKKKMISNNRKTRLSKTKKMNGKVEPEKKKGNRFPDKSPTSQSTKTLTMERIKQHTEATRTDHFFQNLFLCNIPSPTPSQSSSLRKSSVLERAKLFQEFGNESYKSEPSLRSLNIYLSTKRPVSTSRFKNWEKDSISSRSSSPYGVTWPGRSPSQKITKFDSLSRMDELGSSTSLRGRTSELNKEGLKERSLSEPPIKVSSVSETSSKPSTIFPFPRSASPSPNRSPACRRIRNLKQDRADFPPLKVRAKSASEADYYECKKISGSDVSLAKSTSSLEFSSIDRAKYQRYLFEILHSKKKSPKYKDLSDFYASLERMGKLIKTTSTGDLRRRLKDEEIIDYDRWREIRAKERAEQELKTLYDKLKDTQREKDFLFSSKDVESYRWRGDCGLRCKERSVDNIRESFHRLAKEESELQTTRRRDIASKKDIYKPLWRGNSVVDVASNMTRRANREREIDKCTQPTLQRSLGGSNKFWSSLSVEQVNTLKNQLNEIYGTEVSKRGIVKDEGEENSDQIDTCEEIKQKVQQTVTRSQYEVVVPEEFGDGIEEFKGLHVRCHSMLMPDLKTSSETKSSFKRTGSISNGRKSLDRLKTDKSSPLSECEKKRLSLNLGKEVLHKMSKCRNLTTSVTPRETRGAIAARSAKINLQSPKAESIISPRTCYSLEISSDADDFKANENNDFLSVITPNGHSPSNRFEVEDFLEEWGKQPSLLTMGAPPTTSLRKTVESEVDSTTESSENSVKTVVQRENEAEDVPKKIEFFESIENERKSPEKSLNKSKLSLSQSFADLKELFGEIDSARYASLPRSQHTASRRRTTSPGSEKERSTSASPDVSRGRVGGILCREYKENRPRSASPCRVSTSTGSLESIRHRSVSPDPERYWWAYLNLVKHGAVKRLRDKFESLEDLSGDRIKQVATPKRFQSDPELTRILLKQVDEKKIVFKPKEVSDVAWLRCKYEPKRGKAKWRNKSPIPKIPLRLEDLRMPHINVISKTVKLKDSISRSSSMNSLAIKAETEELEAKRPVGRIREKFEKFDGMSILGDSFTSAPDVHELRDISPYLAGKWVAHKYPSRRDNARSISLPPDLENCKSEVVQKKAATLPKRGERTKEMTRMMGGKRHGSILKQTQDPFANQPFDPSKHRPRYRYQPLPPVPPTPNIRKAWWPPMPTYSARPTVTFEG